MQEEDITHFMRQPWVMTSSDGSSGHPRKYGSYPKKIKEYVLEKEVISLEEMISKSAGLPGKIFNIKRRGLIKPGYYADIIIFKPQEVRDNATFENPEGLSEGMEYVLVNGMVTIDQGEYNGSLNGRALRLNQ